MCIMSPNFKLVLAAVLSFNFQDASVSNAGQVLNFGFSSFQDLSFCGFDSHGV